MNGRGDEGRERGFMKEVDNVGMGVCVEEVSVRENVIKVVVGGGGDILERGEIERFEKVMRGRLDEGRGVRKFGGKDIGKVDREVRVRGRFGDGDREKVEVGVKELV